MNPFSLLLGVLLFSVSSGGIIQDELAIGAKAPLTDVKMVSVSGKPVSLKDVAGNKGLIVMFSCNTCPYVLAWEDRFDDVAAAAKKAGIGMIAINANAAQHDGVDSIEEMKKRAASKGYTFEYAVDKNSVLADAFGATKTPHIYLFDANLTLVYRGAIDDNSKSPEKVTEPYLLNAIGELSAGKPVSKSISKALGCTIKRNSGI